MLRSTRELLRFDVTGRDGRIGEVTDFYFDEHDWKIEFMVLDTDGLFSDGKVLINMDYVSELRFPEETFVLGLTNAQAKTLVSGATSPADVEGQVVRSKQAAPQASDAILRSVETISSAGIFASDGPMGNIYSLLVETKTWSIRYLIVDTSHILPGKLVLLTTQAISRLDWDKKSVIASVTADSIRKSPAYDVDSEISREYEAFLHDYYGWPKYW